jgi:aryl-alcohol dehydrogenase-like predicted oxidoreductase
MKRYWHGLNRSTEAIGFGCWQIAGNHFVNGDIPNGWGDIDEDEAVEILVKAMKSGIDFFDTAQGYGYGKSEKILGKAIKKSNLSPVVCTKFELTESEIENNRLDEDFFDRIQNSFNNLDLPYIDILLVHSPPDNIDWSTFDYSKMEKLRSDGKIGTYGVSSRSIKGAIKAAESDFGTVIEWVFNALERRPVKELFPLLKNKNFIARSPLSRGFLNSNWLNAELIFDENDYRSTLPSDWLEWTINSVKKLQSNGIDSSKITEASIEYCLSKEEVTSTIIGIKSMENLNGILELKEKNSINFDESFLNGIDECFPKWK